MPSNLLVYVCAERVGVELGTISRPCSENWSTRYYSTCTVFYVHALFLTGSVNLAVAAVVWSLTSLSTCVAGSHNKRL